MFMKIKAQYLTFDLWQQDTCIHHDRTKKMCSMTVYKFKSWPCSIMLVHCNGHQNLEQSGTIYTC
jgi:hypothetical protein